MNHSTWVLSSVLGIALLSSVGSEKHPATDLVGWREDVALHQLRTTGNNLFRSGQYIRAIDSYQQGYEQAKRQRDSRSAVRFLNNLGSSEYQLYHFRKAIRFYLEARDLATALRDEEGLATIYFNLSSLYYQMGEIDAATESAERGMRVPANALSKFRPKFLIQSALLQIRRKRVSQAIRSLTEAIEASRSELDPATEAEAWNELGSVLLESGSTEAANRALLESFRLRKLNHDDRIHFSYESLAKLRLRQNDPPSAFLLFQRAIETAEPLGPAAVWTSYYERGHANLVQGQPSAAFSDLTAALSKLRNWRAQVLPTETFRISTGVELRQVYSDFIQSAFVLYAKTGQEDLARKAFTAAAESQALDLRPLWAGADLTNQLPPQYWQTLSELQRVETGLLSHHAVAETEPLRELRLKLTEMEARAGIVFTASHSAAAPAQDALARSLEDRLDGDEVLLSFYAGAAQSYVWALTAGGLEFHQLPSEAALRENVIRFVSAIKQRLPSASALGADLYDQLFGMLRPTTLSKPKWLVVPDGPLYELPVAALLEKQPTSSSPRRYLIEKHDLRILADISSVWRPFVEARGPFVGVGDPIYNRADPRFSGMSSASPATELQKEAIELPRLPGSAREIDNCARLWDGFGGLSLVLQGREANKQHLLRTLEDNPAVLHLAVHVLFPANDAGPGMLGLSLEPEQHRQFLTATEIANLRANIGLVVVDGCSSAHAPTLPGAGLMGMTRAWLTAGAHAVIATRWATADQDEGDLFLSLYRNYFTAPRGERAAFSSMLRAAQLAELKLGGPHADPAYWAAYFCVE